MKGLMQVRWRTALGSACRLVLLVVVLVVALAALAVATLATLHPAGRPHLVPVLAVWAHGALCFAAGPGTRKVKNIMQNPAATMTTHGDRLDLVVEGTAVRVADDKGLARSHRWQLYHRAEARRRR